jgi:transcriptional regulator with XRE-family HTH domain
LSVIGDYIKEKRKSSGLTQDEVAARIGKARRTYQYWEQGRSEPDNPAILQLAQILRFDPKEIDNAHKFVAQPPEEKEAYFKTRQRTKNEFDQERDGIAFVPITAQAGYTKSYIDPVFLNQLERFYMPGFPYRGNKYRVFEVDGSSMEPTFKEGYYVVCEKIERDMWHTMPDYYTYVVITGDQVLLKRIFKKSEEVYALISDNEDFFPQFTIKVSDIQEVWQVKRKMDWEMSPPKKFEVKV